MLHAPLSEVLKHAQVAAPSAASSATPSASTPPSNAAVSAPHAASPHATSAHTTVPHIAALDAPGPQRWLAYRLAFDWALDLAEVARHFPPSEQRSLAEPLRTSARRLCVQLAAAWNHRNRAGSRAAALEAAGDALAEVRVWLDFALHDRCITEAGWRELGLCGRKVQEALLVPMPSASVPLQPRA